MLECVCFVQNVRGCEQETDDIQSFNVVCVCVYDYIEQIHHLVP